MTQSIKIYLILLLAIICQTVNAQAPFLSATSNKSTVGLNEQFQITYSLNGSGRNFRGPDLRDFAVLSGPNQSSNMQYVNGDFSQSISFSYILQPRKEGAFKIGSATIEVEGKSIPSNAINITVVKGNNPSAQQRGGGQQNAGDDQSNGGLSDKNIFIRAIVNKTNVVQGEALVVTYKLYTNVNIMNYVVDNMPAFNGFWNQEIKLPEQLQLTNETVDGVNYKCGEIKKVVLFPQQSGNLSIDPMQITCIARVQTKQNRRGNDPFGMFSDPFFGDPFGLGGVKDVKYEFKSNSVKVAVKALPSNAPASFGGSVGKLSMNASIDKLTTKENDPISLKIKISGNGNLKLAEAPVIEFPSDFEVYDPKINENFKTSESGMIGNKTIEYLIIPRHEGEYDLAPIEFTYFDLDKKQYVTESSPPYKIKVLRGNGSSSASINSTAKDDFQLIGRDIRYIKTKTEELDTIDHSFFGSISFYSLGIMPFLLFIGLVAYQKKQDEFSSNKSLMRSRRATSVAKKRLAIAEKAIKDGQNDIVVQEVYKALSGYNSDKLSIPLSEMNKDTIIAEMQKRKVASSIINSLTDTIDYCEMARFGGKLSDIEVTKIYDDTLKLISQLEESLKA